MAAGKKKPVVKYKFELTRGAIGGIGIVCFCIFLWMFLLGVWTGQSLLTPASYDSISEDAGSEENVIDLTDRKKIRPE